MADKNGEMASRKIVSQPLPQPTRHGAHTSVIRGFAGAGAAAAASGPPSAAPAAPRAAAASSALRR